MADKAKTADQPANAVPVDQQIDEAGLGNAVRHTDVESDVNDNVDDKGERTLGAPVPEYKDR